jgi:hypothetical protein
MEFADILEQTIALLQHQGRISYGALKRRFGLDDAYLDDLKIELIEAQQLARDENGRILVWAGQSSAAPPQVVEPALSPALAVSRSPEPRRRQRRPYGWRPSRNIACSGGWRLACGVRWLPSRGGQQKGSRRCTRG